MMRRAILLSSVAKLTLQASSLTSDGGSVTVSKYNGPGGTPTFAWTRISGASSVTADAPSSATTSFTSSHGDGTAAAVFRCTVTLGGQTATVDVSVSIYHAPTPLPPIEVTINTGVGGAGATATAGVDYVHTGLSLSITPYTPPFMISWSASGGSLSNASNYSPTLTVPGQAAGVRVTINLGVSVEDVNSRTDSASASFDVLFA